MAEPGPCFGELQLAQACIDEDPDACSCFDAQFMTTFPNDVERAFQQSIASNDPNSPGFCLQVGSSACSFLQATASCCCHQKTTLYSACRYANDLIVQSPVFVSTCTVEDIVTASCSIEVEPDDQNNQLLIWGIIASVVLCILSLLCSFCCFRKRRRRRKGKNSGSNVNVSISNSANVTKTVTTERQESNAYHHAQEYYQNRKRASGSDDYSSGGDITEETLRAMRAFDWDKFNDDASDLESGGSERSVKEDQENGENFDRRRRRRRSPRRMLAICEEEDDRMDGRKARRMKKERLLLLEDDPRTSREKKKSRSSEKALDTAENSVRKARTLVLGCISQDNEEEQMSPGRLFSLMPQIRHLLGLLEEDRNRLEKSIQKVEDEKIRLQKDLEGSKAGFTHAGNDCIQEAQIENNGLNARFMRMKEENIEIYTLLAMLKKGQDDLVARLESSQQEVQQLRGEAGAATPALPPGYVQKKHSEILDMQDETAAETISEESSEESSSSDDCTDENQHLIERKFQTTYQLTQQDLLLVQEDKSPSNQGFRKKFELSTNETKARQCSGSSVFRSRPPHLSRVDSFDEIQCNRNHLASYQIDNAYQHSVRPENDQRYQRQERLQKAPYSSYSHPASMDGLSHHNGPQPQIQGPRRSFGSMHDQQAGTPMQQPRTHPIAILQSSEIEWDDVSELSAPLRLSQRKSRTAADPPMPRYATPFGPRAANVRELLYQNVQS